MSISNRSLPQTIYCSLNLGFAYQQHTVLIMAGTIITLLVKISFKRTAGQYSIIK